MPVQLIPARLQMTTLLGLPFTTALNWVCPPGCTFTVVGEIDTDTDAKAVAEQTNAVRNNQAVFKMDFICYPVLNRLVDRLECRRTILPFFVDYPLRLPILHTIRVTVGI
jgi:hypothetical protein